jgi:hypothetical protein
MNQRLSNEFLLRLARRAVHIIAPCLRETELRYAFEEFHAAFKEELRWYEFEQQRMAARLPGRPIRKDTTDDNGNGTAPDDNQRLSNEFLLHLARRAVQIIAFCLREEELRDAFEEFYAAFKEELSWYEFEQQRMAARLAGRPIRKETTDDNSSGAVPDDQEQAAGEKS